MTVEASPNLIVPRVYLYTEHDPHADERRALVTQFPGLRRYEGFSIATLRDYVERGGVAELYGYAPEIAAAEKAAAKAVPQPPPLPVNARPAPKAARRDPAAEERAERQRLAATPGLRRNALRS